MANKTNPKARIASLNIAREPEAVALINELLRRELLGMKGNPVASEAAWNTISNWKLLVRYEVSGHIRLNSFGLVVAQYVR